MVRKISSTDERPVEDETKEVKEKKIVSLTTRVFKFKMRPPSPGQILLFEGIFQRKRQIMNYHRKLIKDQQTAMDKFKRKLSKPFGKALNASDLAYAKFGDACQRAKKLSAKARKKVPVPSELREEIDQLWVAAKAAGDQFSVINKELNYREDVVARYASDRDEWQEKIDDAMKGAGLCDFDCESLRGDIKLRMAALFENRKRGNRRPPPFKEHDGTGCVNFRWKYSRKDGCAGLNWRVSETRQAAFDEKFEKRRKARKEAKLRGVIYHGEEARHDVVVNNYHCQARIWFRLRLGKASTFVPCDFKMCREMRPTERIKGTRIVCERTKVKPNWFVILTLQDMGLEREQRKNRFAAIHVGRRRMEDGRVRVAKVLGCDGVREEWFMPVKTDEADDQARALKSAIDTSLDEIKEKLEAWLCLKERVDWLSEATEHLKKWKSPGKMVELINLWSTQRFAGDQHIMVKLGTWLDEYNLLKGQEARLRRASQNRRNTRYGQLIRSLRRRYQYLAVAQTDEAKLAKKELDGDVIAMANVRRLARLASPGKLVELLKGKFGEELISVATSNITRKHHKCGKVNSWKDQSPLVLTCKGCNESFDQDDNALENVYEDGSVYLHDHQEEIDAKVIASITVVPGGAMGAAKRKKAARLAREAAEAAQVG